VGIGVKVLVRSSLAEKNVAKPKLAPKIPTKKPAVVPAKPKAKTPKTLIVPTPHTGPSAAPTPKAITLAEAHKRGIYPNMMKKHPPHRSKAARTVYTPVTKAERLKMGGWASNVTKMPRAFDRTASAHAALHKAELEPKKYRLAYKKFLAARHMVALPTTCKGKAAIALQAKNVTVSSQPVGSLTKDELLGHWNANAAGLQWIIFDYGKPVNINQLDAKVSQNPPGATVHKVYADNQLVHTWTNKLTMTGDVLSWNGKLQARYLKIATIKSPSWAAWKTITAYVCEK
jgi:hypothetical protein